MFVLTVKFQEYTLTYIYIKYMQKANVLKRQLEKTKHL